MHLKLELLQQALAKLLGPIVRLALGQGLKYAEFDQTVRAAMVQEGKRLMERAGQRSDNVSQLATITGIHRKDLSIRIKQSGERLMNTQMSVPSRTYTRWLQWCVNDPALKRLVISDSDNPHSFEELVKHETKGDVHYKAVLDELTRLGVAQLADGGVEINPAGFVPSNDDQMMLAFLADNGRDHLLAAVQNVTEERGKFLERSVFAHGLSDQACQELLAKARGQWATTHALLFDDVLKAGDDEASTHPEPDVPYRMRMGIYAYYEPIDAELDNPATAQKSKVKDA
jgi:Family of unknown function (DUF6502)